jgi:acyl dehydratase
MTDAVRIIEGPCFEDLRVGQWLPDPPAVTLTSGHAAWHAALFGDRLRLPLSAPLAQAVLGGEAMAAHPALVCNLVTGQTTYATQEVRANLFYRGLLLRVPVRIGDTLATRTQVVALRQNRRQEGRPATGIAVLEMDVRDQRGETVLHFWRAPMIPCRDPQADTGHADALDVFPAALDADALAVAAAPYDIAAFANAVPGAAGPAAGTRFQVAARDTVTCAPELVRLTLNMARAHTDAARSAYGQRLVYGGHTIALAAAQLTRALPDLVTILGWHGCDHLAPVFEGDLLGSQITVEAVRPLPGGGALLDLKVEVTAERAPTAPHPGSTATVLDWRLVALAP